MNGGSTSNRTPPHRQLPRMILLIHDSQLLSQQRQRLCWLELTALRFRNFNDFDLAMSAYFAMQMFFGSVKKRRASSPPSRPTPLCFMPPNGTRRSRTNQQFTQTVPVLIRSATRWARPRFCVQTLDERPYSTSSAWLITSSSLSKGVIVTTGPKISSRLVRHETDRLVMTVGGKK